MSGFTKFVAVFSQQGLIGGNDIFARLKHFKLDLLCCISSADQLDTYLNGVII
ncbi:hypothetical protein ES703_115557 [subsurface metagenome]